MTDAAAEAAYLTIGVDGSTSAQFAVEWGLAEARRRSLAVRLVAAWSVPVTVAGPAPGLAIPAMVISARTAARHAADDAAKLAADAGVEATVEVCEGGPAEVLGTCSEGADQLVVGAHGHSTPVRHLLGSVSTAVAHHARVPVTVVRHLPQRPQHRVVVGIDGSKPAEAALRRAAIEAAAADAELCVVIAYDELRDQARQRAEQSMERAAAHLGSVTVKLSVIPGAPDRVLCRESVYADLLVVGTHGWSAVDQSLFGSTSTAVLHRAPGPVQVMPSFG
ncbi:MAG: hypothetical protein QOG34_604 [Frankiaceae bacterium]|nr:hypothetical protein [Frankiaceae bacterium]